MAQVGVVSCRRFRFVFQRLPLLTSKGSVAVSPSPWCTQSPLTGGTVKAWDYRKPASDLEVGPVQVEHLVPLL